MNKKEFLKTIDIASYFALVVASIGVLLFEFTGSVFALKAAIVLYATSFLTYLVLNVLKLIYFIKKVEFEGQYLIDREKTKLWQIIAKIIFGIICLVLAIIVLVNF